MIGPASVWGISPVQGVNPVQKIGPAQGTGSVQRVTEKKIITIEILFSTQQRHVSSVTFLLSFLPSHSPLFPLIPLHFFYMGLLSKFQIFWSSSHCRSKWTSVLQMKERDNAEYPTLLHSSLLHLLFLDLLLVLILLSILVPCYSCIYCHLYFWLLLRFVQGSCKGEPLYFNEYKSISCPYLDDGKQHLNASLLTTYFFLLFVMNINH